MSPAELITYHHSNPFNGTGCPLNFSFLTVYYIQKCIKNHLLSSSSSPPFLLPPALSKELTNRRMLSWMPVHPAGMCISRSKVTPDRTIDSYLRLDSLVHHYGRALTAVVTHESAPYVLLL
jgi:hypothetical protein